MAKQRRPAAKPDVNDARVQDLLNNAWLDLDDHSFNNLKNPFDGRTAKDIAHPDLHLLSLMRNPDYFGFTCKHIFNKIISPMQVVILQELWHRPFPMLIGSRGFGKCVTGDTLIMVDNRLCRISELVDGAAPMAKVFNHGLKVQGEKGFRAVEYAWNNGLSKTRKLTTRYGYTLEGTLNHPIRVVRGESLEWVELQHVKVGDRIPLDRSPEWFDADYKMDSETAYLLGILTAQAHKNPITGKIQVACPRPEIEEAVRVLLRSKWGYHCGPEDITIDNEDLLLRYGFDELTRATRDVPKVILGAPKEAVKTFLSAVFDVAGFLQNNGRRLYLAHKSSKFVTTLQQLLLRFGIICKNRPRLNMGLETLEIGGRSLRLFLQRIGFLRATDKIGRAIQIVPLSRASRCEQYPHELVRHRLQELAQYHPGVKKLARDFKRELSFDDLVAILNLTKETCREHTCWKILREEVRRDYFYDVVKTLTPGEAVTYDVHVPDDHSFISNGFISHNSFILGLYAMLRATLTQGSKVVIVGAGFRQAKVVFDYCEHFWDNSPILRDMCGDLKKNGPRFAVDRLSLRIGDSLITALPLGDGCLVASTYLMNKDGWTTIGSNLPDEKYVHSRKTNLLAQGEWVESDEAYSNGLADTVKLRTTRGFTLEGTPNHKVKIWDRASLKVCWKRLDELKRGDYLLMDRSQQWHEGDNGLNEVDSYQLGKQSISDKFPDVAIDILFGARKNVVAAFLRGMMDRKGYVAKTSRSGQVILGVSIKNEKLIRFLQQVLLRFGIISKVRAERFYKWNLELTSGEIILFQERIGLGRDLEHRVKMVFDKVKPTGHYDVIPGISSVVRKIEAKHRVAKQPIINDKLRKAVPRELILKLREQYQWTNHPIFDQLEEVLTPDIFLEKVVGIEEGRALTYDCHVPSTHFYTANGFVAHNTKIRGQRATHLICDEFASVPIPIYQNVVEGFAAVSANPIENMQKVARQKKLIQLGYLEADAANENLVASNQSIISGTAYYSFCAFYEYWKRWKGIIESRGDPELLSKAIGGEPGPHFKWRDYSIIRIPYDMIPEGYMDDKVVAKSKATQHSSNFLCEFGATFVHDSDGFFSRKLIETCVVGRPANPISLPSCENVDFSACLVGTKNRKYVMGIDPASEKDNFSIVILEVWPDHRRIVYAWTTNDKRHKEQLKANLASESNFYQHVAKKIRDLHALFPCERIALDMQGGGKAVLETLGDTAYARFRQGEGPIYAVPDEAKPSITDDMPGEHIVTPIQFAKSDWVSMANHNLKKGFEDKTILFPSYDRAVLGMAVEEDEKAKRRGGNFDSRTDELFDTLEDCIREIEELKDELATIEHSRTSVSGREHWDTPQTKEPGGKKGRLRKDRYSSLLMANATALLYQFELTQQMPEYTHFGGFAHQMAQGGSNKVSAQGSGPLWYQQGMAKINGVLGGR